jgi:hypothetical protein
MQAKSSEALQASHPGGFFVIKENLTGIGIKSFKAATLPS